MSGYTQVHATGAGVGAREVLDAVVHRYEARDDDGSAREVGEVIQTYDRSAYLEFTTKEAHLGPPVVVLGGPTFDGPLATRVEPAAGGPTRGWHGLSVRDRPVAPGDRVQIRTTAGASGDVDRVALSVGDTLDVLLARDLCQPAEESIARYHEASSIGRDSDVWNRARRTLRRLDDRDVEDGLGWRSDLSGMVEGGASNDELRVVADGWASLLDGTEADIPASGWLDVLGRGPGSTPSGDDLVAGILLTLFRTTTGHRRERISRAGERVVARAEDRTAKVSTALLAQAARGRTSERVESWLRALLTPTGSERRCAEAVADVIDMGHTSGVDTVVGALLAVLLVCPAVGDGHA